MRRARETTIYDALRIPVGINGGLISPSMQSEREAMTVFGVASGMDTSGIGQADTTARTPRTFTGGQLMPQGYLNRQPAGFLDVGQDAGKAMNARAALPNRGISPAHATPKQKGGPASDRRRRTTPLAKRR